MFHIVDDVLIIAIGPLMLTIFARDINFAHKHLQAMGANIALREKLLLCEHAYC